MFRRLETGLPQDPHFPSDLNALGFFINDKHQIRKIKHPDKEFVFRVTNDERTNEVHREAFHIAVRKEVRSRLRELGVGRIYLPQLTTKKPKAPHVAIIATPLSELRLKKRVLVVVNDEFQDLGIFAWRMLARDSGIEEGSCIALLKELIDRSSAKDASNEEQNSKAAKPGIIILNPGQLNYSYSLNESMSRSTWFARNAPSAVHPTIPIHAKNFVGANKTPEEHVATVFDHVIADTKFVHPNAEIYIIGMQCKGDLILQYLDSHWDVWSDRVKALALMEPQHSASSIKSKAFKTFLELRGRAWALSAGPANIPLAVPNGSAHAKGFRSDPSRQSEPEPPPNLHALIQTSACPYIDWCENGTTEHNDNSPTEPSSNLPSRFHSDSGPSPPLVSIDEVFDDLDLTTKTQPTYSAGDLTYGECIFPTVYKTVLDWFEEVARAPLSYANPVILESELWQPQDAVINDEEQGPELPPDDKGLQHLDQTQDRSAAVGDGNKAATSFDHALQDMEYAGGENDAKEEHGAFVAKTLEEPNVKVGGVQVPASLVASAGLGTDEDADN